MIVVLEVVDVEQTVAEIHSAVTLARVRDASSAAKRATSPESVPTQAVAKVEPPLNVSNAASKDTSLASAPPAAATSASTARRRATSRAIARPRGR